MWESKCCIAMKHIKSENKMLVKFWIDDDQWEDSEFSKREWHEGFLTPNDVITVGFFINLFTISGIKSNEKVLNEIIPESGIYRFQGQIQEIYNTKKGESRKEAIIDCGFHLQVHYPYEKIIKEYDSLFGFGMLWGDTSFTLFPVSPVKCIFKESIDFEWDKGGYDIHFVTCTIEDNWEMLEPDYKLSIIHEHELVYKLR